MPNNFLQQNIVNLAMIKGLVIYKITEKIA